MAASILVATVAAFAALSAAERRAVARERGASGRAWLWAGSLAMGAGVWCMHFVGMLAFTLPLPVAYDPALTALSLAPAVASGLVIVGLAARRTLTRAGLHAAGLLIGLGIATMHYAGMAAMRLAAQMAYDPLLFGLSLIAAYALATAAVAARFRLQASALPEAARQAFGSLALGAAVAGMHYSGMAATRYFGAAVPVTPHPQGAGSLPALVSTGCLVLALVLAAIAFVDRRLERAGLKVRQLIESAPDAFVVVDPGGLIRVFNARAEELFGYGRAEVLGRPLEILLPEALRAAHRRHREDYSRTPSTRAMGVGAGFRGRRKDGSEFPVDVSLSHEKTSEGVFVTSIIRDISERLAARRLESLVDLEHSVTKLLAGSRDPLESAPEIIGAICAKLGWEYGGWWLVSTVSRELRCVATWHGGGEGLEQFAADSRQAQFRPGVGLPARVWSSGRAALSPDIGADGDFLRAPAAQRAGLRSVLAVPIKAGSETLGAMDFLSSRIVEPDERLLAALESIGSQIGQSLMRRQSELVAAQAQKMDAIGRFAAGIAHDFNNHLASILGLCGLLGHQLPPGRAADDVAEIKATAERAAELTKQIVSVGRRKTGSVGFGDANDLLRANERFLARLVGSQVKIETSPAPDPLPVRIAPGDFAQILMNLVVNACDAMPDGGTISLSAAQAGDCVEISVRDSGTGIPRAILDRIFEPFFTTKPEGRGTGLGLAIVHGLVKSCGGRIAVDSEPGRGTVFYLSFPLARGQAKPLPAAAEPAARAGRSGTILLVDDDAQVARVASRIVESLGYRVLVAGSADQALEVFRREGPSVDMILTDINMPGTDGVVLARRIRELRPGARILFMSGYGLDSLRTEEPPRPEDFIAKPFTAEELGRRLDELAARP